MNKIQSASLMVYFNLNSYCLETKPSFTARTVEGRLSFSWVLWDEKRWFGIHFPDKLHEESHSHVVADICSDWRHRVPDISSHYIAFGNILKPTGFADGQDVKYKSKWKCKMPPIFLSVYCMNGVDFQKLENIIRRFHLQDIDTGLGF